MKNFFKFFGIAASIVVFGLSFIACIIYVNGDGGTRQSAITLSNDTWADGSISSTSHEQWFRFTATVGTQYLHVFFGTLTSLHIQLYDNHNNEIGDRISMSGATTYTPLTITSGREYHIRVSPNGSGTGTYRIEIGRAHV